MNTTAPNCPKCGTPMQLARASYFARVLVLVPLVFGAMTVIAAIALGAWLLGVPDEGVEAILTILIGAYLIAHFRFTERLQPDVDPLFICETCHRRVKPKRNVQSNNALERTVASRDTGYGERRSLTSRSSWPAAQLGR